MNTNKLGTLTLIAAGILLSSLITTLTGCGGSDGASPGSARIGLNHGEDGGAGADSDDDSNCDGPWCDSGSGDDDERDGDLDSDGSDHGWGDSDDDDGHDDGGWGDWSHHDGHSRHGGCPGDDGHGGSSSGGSGNGGSGDGGSGNGGSSGSGSEKQ